MLKNIAISALAVVVLLAIGFSAYNVLAGGRADAALSTASGLGNTPGYTQDSPQGNAAGQAAPQWNAAGQGVPQGNAGNQGGGQGRGQGRGGQGRGGGAGQTGGQANPQNGFTGYSTYQGTVSDYAAPNFTLITADGQKFPVQLGNQNYAVNLGLNLQNGDAVTITGFLDPSGSIAAGTITLDATGQIFTLRTTTGRPAWAGGGRN